MTSKPQTVGKAKSELIFGLPIKNHVKNIVHS
jgi:hypothetical protein